MADENISCADIQANIDDDLLRIQTLKSQKARTRNSAQVALIQQEIEQLVQEIATLEQQKQDLGC